LDAIAEIYQTESRRVLATLIKLLGDFDLAEEALHDAFASAAESWAREGLPSNPQAWLVSTGRFKAIDRIRRRARFNEAKADLIVRFEEVAATNAAKSEQSEDDRRRSTAIDFHLLPSSDRASSSNRFDVA